MQELIQKHQDAKFSVSTCKVKGVQYTSHEFLATITKPILAASTLREIIAGSQNIGLQLSKLGIFESVDILLDYASNDSVDVIYQVKESSRLYARTGVDFEQESSLLNLSINIRNLFGRGEQLSGFANQSVDSTNSNNLGGMSHSLSFRKPILGDPDESLLINASIQNNNHMGLMSHMEKTSGLNIGYCLVRDLLSYNIRYNSVWRENYGFGDFASQSVRRHAGHSLKSSIEHDILIDTRNDPIFPQSGYYVKLKQECAGLGGDVQFLKNQLSSTLVYSLPLDMTASGSIRAGLIVPISSNIDAGARINDKFHMGGPLSLRGFSQGGVGPRKSDDFIGGSLFVGSSVNLFFPIPRLPKHFFQGHFFANAGSLVDRDSNSIHENFKQLLDTPRAAVGLGIAARFSNFKLELNYCHPLLIQAGDRVKHGLQFGVGLEFL